MSTFLGSRLASFKGLELVINFSELESKSVMPAAILEHPIRSGLSVGKEGDALLNAIKKSGEPEIYFYTKEQDSKLQEKLHLSIIKDFVTSTIFRGLHSAFFSRVYYFAAERTSLVSLVSSAKGIEKREMPEGEIKKKEDDSGSIALAVPVGGLLDIVTEARFTGSKETRLKRSKKDPRILTYLKSAELLQEILGGNLDFTKPEACLDRELIFKYDSEVPLVLDLAVVSSMVKDLSALVLYLQYFAMPGDLLVIDEPEMNLHPKAQVELTELLAILVNSGLHILITTHSPYVVDHLTNLMKAYSHEDKEAIKNRFYLKKKESFISPKDVSVYLFDKNTAKNILGKEGLIDWETFSSVSEQISQLYFEL